MILNWSQYQSSWNLPICQSANLISRHKEYVVTPGSTWYYLCTGDHVTLLTKVFVEGDYYIPSDQPGWHWKCKSFIVTRIHNLLFHSSMSFLLLRIISQENLNDFMQLCSLFLLFCSQDRVKSIDYDAGQNTQAKVVLTQLV